MARKKSTDKPSREVSINIRTSPRTRFILELLARKQRRSATAVIETLLDQAALKDLLLEEDADSPTGETRKNQQSLVDYLWDVDEVYRLANMAKHEPTLMTYDEEMLWRVIQEEPGFWIETEIPLPSFERVYWEYMEGIWLNIPLVRQAWEVVKAVADMEVDPDELSCRVDELKSQMEMRGSGD